MTEVDLDHALAVARRALDAAAAAAMKHYDVGVKVETKPDRSPVTAADRESEVAILEVLQSAFPDHSILAEESGKQDKAPHARWIVDPIDGTRGFTRGGKFWGALIALELDGEIVVGAMGLPALGDQYWARKGGGTFKNGVARRVTAIDALEDATVSLGEMGPLLSPPHGPRVTDVVRTAASARCYGDLEGVAMVLDGLADVWLEHGVQPWDLAPTKILLEEAGGRFTTFDGGDSIHLGHAVGSNGLLHDRVLQMISRS